MKKNYYTLRACAYLAATVGTIFIVCTVYILCASKKKVYEYQLDYLLSKKQKQIIKDYIQNSACTCNTLLTQLKKEFPFIESINIVSTPICKPCITITVQKPLYCINDEYVLTNKNILVEKNSYKQVHTDTLALITVQEIVHNKPFISHSLLCALYFIPAYIYKKYRCVWKNRTDAWLYDKQDPYWIIRFNSYTLPTTKLTDACDTLKNLGAHTKKTLHKTQQYVIADIRFGDQIIVYVKKGDE